MSRDGLPRAYLRMSPNLDQHPDPLGMILLICGAARQPDRGRFTDAVILHRILGKKRFAEMVERNDIELLPDGRWYATGWDQWQEGDQTVGERMARMRRRRAAEGHPIKSGSQRTADWRLRTFIFQRDSFTCRYCGAWGYPRDLLIAEHVDPGGATDAANLVTACRPCNVRKGTRTPEGAGMTLHEPGYRSAEPSGDTPRVTRPVTRHRPPERVTVTTDAVVDDSIGSLHGVDVDSESPPPPAKRGLRNNGTNPRARKTSPRQTGDNPRANGQSIRQEREAQKRGPVSVGDILRRAAAVGSER